MMGAASMGPAAQIFCAKTMGEPYEDQPAWLTFIVGGGCTWWSVKDLLDLFKKGGNGPPPPAAGATPVAVDVPAPQPAEGEDGGSAGLSLWRAATTSPLATGTFSPAGIVSTPTAGTVPGGCDTPLPAGAIRWATGRCPGSPGHQAGEPVFGAKTVGAKLVLPSAPIAGSGSVTPPKATVPAVRGAPHRATGTSGRATSTPERATTPTKPGGTTVQAQPPPATSVPSPWSKKDPNEQWLTEHCGNGGGWLTGACRATSTLNPTYPGSPLHSFIFGAGGEGAVAPVVP